MIMKMKVSIINLVYFGMSVLLRHNANCAMNRVPENTTALLGKNTTLFCEGDSTEISNAWFAWRKGPEILTNKNITLNSTAKYEVSGKYNLNIKTTDFEDEGEYTCETLNENFKVWLQVADGAKTVEMKNEQESSTLTVGPHHYFQCVVSKSRPQPTISWTFNNMDISGYATVSCKNSSIEGYVESTTSRLRYRFGKLDTGKLLSCHITLGLLKNVNSQSITITTSGATNWPGDYNTILILLTQSWYLLRF